MTKKQDILIKKIYKQNNPIYNLHKAAEEFQELALVLTQLALKPQKVDHQEVIDEIGDCKIRLRILEQIFDNKKIEERIKFKLGNFEGYLKEGKYKGGI